MRLGPMVTVRNPDVAQVALEKQALTPDFGELVQGILSGQVPDIRAAMEDLQSRSNAELERAIAAAQEKGADVSRDDFIFADWDPTQEFTEDMYAQS
jgi:multiple sugar transport system substrate-binding protein